MKKVLLLGGSGFIGRNFVKKYHSKFDITIVDQFVGSNKLLDVKEVKGDVSDGDFVVQVSKGAYCIVNLVYNKYDLIKNIKIINNIINACVINEIDKLIHISSLSVYDPFIKGNLDEASKYSTLSDPYSNIKQRQEKLLEIFFRKYRKCEIVILQPTIIYGDGGNWSKHANKEIQKEKLFLPNEGNHICNIVSINEVIEAICLVIDNDHSANSIERFLISGERHITWKEFYDMHRKELNVLTNYSVHDVKSGNRYHDNFFINALYGLIFSKFGYYIVLLLNKCIYKIKNKVEKKDSSKAFTPVGMNRLVHTSSFIVNTEKFSKVYSSKKGIKQFFSN